MGKHARFSPSSAHRFINCAGSTTLCETVPPLPDTVYGMEGSAAHLLAQRCLELDIDAALKIGSPLEYNTWQETVTTEMAGAVQVYLDEIRRKQQFTGKHFIEKKVSLSWLVPDCFGTADHIAVEVLDCLYVDDFKYGAGVVVEVTDNPQFLTYALGALGEDNPYGVQEVELTVIQPRAFHSAGPVRKVRMSVDNLYNWGRTVFRPAVERALAPNPSFTAGEWCRWCQGKINCPEIREEVRKAAGTMFDSAIIPAEPKAQLPEVKKLTADQLNRILTFSPIFSAWLDAVKDESISRLERGAEDAPTDWKLVQGRPSRQWKNEAAIRKFITEFPGINMYAERVFKSPAQMETEFKTRKLNIKLLDDFIEKKNGSPKLTTRGDPRPALSGMFD